MDDDVYVNVEQLKNLLLHYDSLKPYYVGRHWRTELGLTVIRIIYIALLCACNYELYYVSVSYVYISASSFIYLSVLT